MVSEERNQNLKENSRKALLNITLDTGSYSS